MKRLVVFLASALLCLGVFAAPSAFAASKPGVPTAVSARASGTSATIKWSPPTSNGGSSITGYYVSRDGTDSNGGGAYATVKSSTTRSFTFNLLRPGVTYHLTVAARNVAGQGVGVVKTVVMPGGTLPGKPQNIQKTQADGTAGIAWTDADPGSSPITGWRVARDGVDVNGGGPYATTVPTTTSQFLFTLLVNGSSYSLSVSAVTAAGVGPAAKIIATPEPWYYGPGTPCGTAGTYDTFANFGNLVCDGFTWSYAAYWNARLTRQTATVSTLTYSFACSTNNGATDTFDANAYETRTLGSGYQEQLNSTLPTTNGCHGSVVITTTVSGSAFQPGLATMYLHDENSGGIDRYVLARVI